MIEINFKFREKDNIIECETGRVFKDVCLEFSNKLKLDLDYIIFIYRGIKINLEKNLYVGQELDVENPELQGKKRFELLVFEESAFSVIFKYQGNDYIIGVKETDKMDNVLKKFESKANVYMQNVFFTYSGNIITEDIFSKKVNDIINNLDRKERVMSILVNDFERNSMRSVLSIKQERLLPPDPYDHNNNVNNNIYSNYFNTNPSNNGYDNNYNEFNDNYVDSERNIIVRIEEQSRHHNTSNCCKEIKCSCNCRDFDLMTIKPIYILFVQFLFMTIVASVGLNLKLTKNEEDVFVFTLALNILQFLAIFFDCIYFCCNKFKPNKFWFIYHILFVILMSISIIFTPESSENIFKRYMLSILTIILLALVSIMIFKPKKASYLFLFCFLSNIIAVIPLHFLLIHNGIKSVLILSGIALLFDAYCWLLNCIIRIFIEVDEEDYIKSVIYFDYGPFIIVVLIYGIFFYACYKGLVRD